MGNVDGRDRYAHQLTSRAADHLAVRDVLPQILADLPADDLLEALLVVIYGSSHGVLK